MFFFCPNSLIVKLSILDATTGEAPALSVVAPEEVLVVAVEVVVPGIGRTLL